MSAGALPGKLETFLFQPHTRLVTLSLSLDSWAQGAQACPVNTDERPSRAHST